MSALPKYVMSDLDRHGNTRWYYRRFGRKIRLPRPDEQEFECAMKRAAVEIVDLVRPPRRDARAMSTRLPMIYFIRHGNKRVKIGRSIEVDRRLSEIRVGLPGKARILYLTPGGADLEGSLHRRFASDRVNGEWFQYSQAIRDWISADKLTRQERASNKSVPPSDAPYGPTSPTIKLIVINQQVG